MALVPLDRAQQTGTANTTVSFTLTGSVVGFQSLAGVGNGNTTPYAATDASGNWEVGIGTYSTTGPTLTRTTVLASSNAGAAVTFSGTVNVWSDYPAGKAVYLDASGNVSPLGTVASGTWQGSTIQPAYGGTGVTSSTGANSVVLRDANQNIAFNNFNATSSIVTAAAGTTVLTAASGRNQILVGSTTQTFQLPVATTLALGHSFTFINNSSGALTVKDSASATVETVPSGGVTQLGATNVSTSAGTWGAYSFIPAAVDWGTNALNLATTVISGGTWNGGTISSAYGGTGLTTFVGANNALYSTSSSALTAGTLPVAAGGTGLTSLTANYIPYGNGTGNYQSSSTFTFNGTTFSAPTASLTGNLVFTGTSNRITGDFSNVTDSSRVLIQTSTANDSTYVGVIPNGTGTSAGSIYYGSADTANANYLGIINIGSTEARIIAGATGSGIERPMVFYAGGVERIRIATTGAIAFGSSTSYGTAGQVLQSNGNAPPTWVTSSGGGPVASGTMYENSLVISANYTLTTGKNAMSVGPITINSGVTVTVPSGQRWVVL